MAAMEPVRRRAPVRRMSLHEEIVGRLRDMVLDGGLPPGQWVPELKLCDELGVSRTPLREALKVLASENLVTLMQNRGAVVAEIVPGDIVEMFEVMHPLEAAIGRLVVARASDDDLAAAQAMHARMVESHAQGARARYFEINQAIHQRFADLTGNRTLSSTYAGFAGKIRRARSLANISDARWAESVSEHEAFMAVLERRDAAAFARLLEQHSERTGAVVCARLAALADETAALTKKSIA
jgi:DNA-binding GntR family transcriptional regulator